MKKLNFMLSLALFATSLGIQAQKTIASVGFEPGDSKYTTSFAYTPGGTYGDWVNPSTNDVWNEQHKGDAHSGEYSMLLKNDETIDGNTWDRGFKVGNLQLKNNTSYRVSFWVKADPTYLDNEGGEKDTRIKSSLSIGREYCDMPISTKNGLQYYFNYLTGMTGEWRHISYLTFFTNKADQDAFSINYTGKEDPNGVIVVPQADPFPEDYFLIINAYSATQYLLDDITVEEGVTFNEASFNKYAIKLDFGYETNIAALAKANEGTIALDPSIVNVTVNGAAATPDCLEGKEDGFLYIFFKNTKLQETDKIVVSFTPTADCPLIYTNNRRPSDDVDSEMKVLAFANEQAIWNPTINAIPEFWSAPKVVETSPENDSFELDPETFTKVVFTYDKEINIDFATVTLSYSDNFGMHEEDITEELSVSEDKMSAIVNADYLEDGEYTISITGIRNEYGYSTTNPDAVTFEIGVNPDDSPSETIFQTDFDHELTEGIPQGWITYNEAGYHLYGFNDPDTKTSQFTYHYGGNPGGGGTRLFDGFSGDFNKGMYWGTRGTDEGWCTFGAQVQDYMDENGVVSADMPEGIALKLEPRKYQISFLMAAWKGEPTFTFTLEDLAGNVFAKFDNIVASPNMNGAKGKVTGSVKCQSDFVVDHEGYYVLRFTSNPAVWQEFLLADVKLISMPAKSLYFRQLLEQAVEKAEMTYALADGDMYDGETKTALAEVLNRAKTETYHSGLAIEKVIEEIETLNEALAKRVDNIDNYAIACGDANYILENLEDKYKDTDLANEMKEFVNKYSNIDPSTLSDEELNNVTPKLVNIAASVSNIKNIIDTYTFGIMKSMLAYEKLGGDTTKDAYVKASKASSNDRAIAAALNAEIKGLVYDIIAKKGTVPTEYFDYVNYHEYVDEYDELHPGDYRWDVAGIELTGFINNPKLYREYGNSGLPGWEITGVGENENGEPNAANIAWAGTAPTETNPATDMYMEIYGASNYNLSQVLTGLPAGIYAVKMSTRTYRGVVNQNGADVDVYYNAQNPETGLWDKYIFAGDAVVPFLGGSWAYGGDANNTIIENVTVGADGTLTIGAQEYYTSGLAFKNDATGTLTSFWEGTTMFDDIRIFLVAPLAGFDYAAAATAIETVNATSGSTIAEVYNVSGAKVNGMQKGVNIVKYTNGTVQKVIVK